MSRPIQFRQLNEFGDFHYWGFNINPTTGEDKPNGGFVNPIADTRDSEQFTGLYDSTKWDDLTDDEKVKFMTSSGTMVEWKGRKIWEGDIVRMWYDDADGGLSVIAWNRAGLKIKHPTHSAFGEIYKGCEVIGNIHQNKNLLK